MFKKTKLKKDLKSYFHKKAKDQHIRRTSKLAGVVTGPTVLGAVPFFFIEPFTATLALITAGGLHLSAVVGGISNKSFESAAHEEWESLSGQTLYGTIVEKRRQKALQDEIIRLNELRPTLTEESDIETYNTIIAKFETYKQTLFKDVEVRNAGNMGASETEVTFLNERPTEAIKAKLKASQKPKPFQI